MQMLFANGKDKIIEALFRCKGACRLTLKKGRNDVFQDNRSCTYSLFWFKKKLVGIQH